VADFRRPEGFISVIWSPKNFFCCQWIGLGGIRSEWVFGSAEVGQGLELFGSGSRNNGASLPRLLLLMVRKRL
jgi:hypothetical protein